MISRDFGADFAMGAQNGDFDVHADFLAHVRDLLPQPAKGSLPFYFGIGLKVKTESPTWSGYTTSRPAVR